MGGLIIDLEAIKDYSLSLKLHAAVKDEALQIANETLITYASKLLPYG